jgi:hypothetical protein
VVRPNSKWAVVDDPFGLTVPLRVAPVEVTLDAAVVVTVGGSPGVVKVTSSPEFDPPLLLARSRKWYVLFGVKPLMFALTNWEFAPVKLWFDVAVP